MSETMAKEQGLLTASELLEQLNWRYATKKFDPNKKISAGVWAALEEALVLSPSSYGLQPWKFFVIEDSALREKLKAASWKQPQITDASHLVVFTVKKNIDAADVEHYVERIAEVRGVTRDSLEGYKQMMLGTVGKAGKGLDVDAWSAQQVYIALGTFLTSAAVLGVDACPMEGIDSEAYDRILGLEAHGYHALCVATAGYRAEDDGYARLAKVRFPHDEVVAHV